MSNLTERAQHQGEVANQPSANMQPGVHSQVNQAAASGVNQTPEVKRLAVSVTLSAKAHDYYLQAAMLDDRSLAKFLARKLEAEVPRA